MGGANHEHIFGLGLRYPHHQYVLQNLPSVDFFEIHSENFIAQGGASINFLQRISEHYKISFHCIGLSIGSASGINPDHLKNLKHLNDTFKPFLFSDHLSWANSSKVGTANDLLPIPYTLESLDVCVQNVDLIQNTLGRKMLIENPSAYIEYKTSVIEETDFLNTLAAKTGCGILLDINNVYVSCKNFGYDEKLYLKNINSSAVGEIHLAGHTFYEETGLRVDTHHTYISDDVLKLYQSYIVQTGIKVPTLIEWDEDIPEFSVLMDELNKVKRSSL